MAIDSAWDVGFSYAYPGEQPIWGSKRMGPRGGLAGELFLPFFLWLDARITEWQPKHVCYMAPIRTAHDTTDRLQKLFGLTAVVTLVVERRKMTDMPGILAHHSEDRSVVQFLCGQSRWPKPKSTEKKKAAVMDALRARYNWDVKGDDDAGDALALFLYVENKLAPKIAVSRGVGPLWAGAA